MRHSLNPGCPCDDCARERFGDRAALLVVVAMCAIAGLAMLAVAL